jgi:hypothetical protein
LSNKRRKKESASRLKGDIDMPNNARTYWNRQIGKKVVLNYDCDSPQAKQWNGRQGICKGVDRGDCDVNDPYVTIWITTKPDGTRINGFLWQPPAHAVKLEIKHKGNNMNKKHR